MNTRIFGTIVAALALSTAPVRAQSAKKAYVTMAPIDQYLMDRSAEMALARSAAPESISLGAEVWILGRHGYESTGLGRNGFVCLVERGWAADSSDVEFMNPELRYPVCLNAAAARYRLPLTFKKTEFALAGFNKSQIYDSTKAGYDRGKLPQPDAGAMCYMLSKHANYGGSIAGGAPHLMFFVPRTSALTWGALPGSPIMAYQNSAEPVTTFVVWVPRWSDGSAAPEEGR